MAKTKAVDPATLTPEELVNGYRILGEWKPGMSMYGCNFCRFDSLRETVTREHVIQVHQFEVIDAQKAPEKELNIQLLDASGRPIAKRDMTETEIDEHNAKAAERYRS